MSFAATARRLAIFRGTYYNYTTILQPMEDYQGQGHVSMRISAWSHAVGMHLPAPPLLRLIVLLVLHPASAAIAALSLSLIAKAARMGCSVRRLSVAAARARPTVGATDWRLSAGLLDTIFRVALVIRGAFRGLLFHNSSQIFYRQTSKKKTLTMRNK